MKQQSELPRIGAVRLVRSISIPGIALGLTLIKASDELAIEATTTGVRFTHVSGKQALVPYTHVEYISYNVV